MRGAAMGLGIAGGVIGILSAIVIQIIGATIGGIGAGVEDQESIESGATIVNLAWGAYVFSIIGIFGGAFSTAKPKLAALLQIVAALGILISISFGAIIASPLLFIGAVLAFLGRKSSRPPERRPA